MEYISLYHAKIITELGMKSSKEGHLRAPFGLFFSLMYCFLIFCQTLSFWLSPQTDQQQRIGNTAAVLVHRALDGAYYLICSQNFSRREARQRFLVSLEELASSMETSPNNIPSLLSGFQPLSSIFPCLILVPASNFC